MVSKELGVKSAKELNGATICVQPGTTTELNLADWFRSQKIEFKPVVIDKYDEIIRAFSAGRCDAFTTDKSQLASTRTTLENPDNFVILPEDFSKEPLGPMVRQGDRSEEHTSELQSLMRISYAVFCLKKKKQTKTSL